MDTLNRYHTPKSWNLARAEQLGLLLLAVGLAVANLPEIRWWAFIAAFVAIDLIGYLPGAVAHRRAKGAPISPVYHHLYNATHNYLTLALVAGAWALAAGSLEPAMLAFPIHLAGDRGIFGNTFKPTELPFEPAAVDPLRWLERPAAPLAAPPALQEVA